MSNFNIKTLLNRKLFLKIVKDVERLSGTFIIIKDSESHLVYGSDVNEAFNECYPVEINGEVFCWILCKKKTVEPVAIITYMIMCEYEKRSVSADTLEKYKELNLLYNFSEKILLCLDLTEVCGITLEEAKKVIKCTSGRVVLKNEETQEYETVVSYEKDKSITPPEDQGIGIEKSVIEKGAGEIINDVISDPRFDGDPETMKVMICVPLKVKNSVTGAISLSYNSHIIYKAEELKILNALASQAAAAIENAKMFFEIRESHSETLNLLLETVEMIDRGNKGHCKRVMKYSMMIGEELELSKKELSFLKFSSILHDIGKVGITADEFHKHPERGVSLLKHIKKLAPALPAINHHHENFDGTGYPDGLKGEKIPRGARIIAVASEFDHLLTEASWDFEKAAAEIKKLMGNKLDPKITAKFLGLYNNRINDMQFEGI